MKKTLLFSACCLAAAMLAVETANAQSVETYPSYIEVNGFAEQEVTPDVFYMTIRINEMDSKGKKSLEEQQHAMVKALKSIGIDTDSQLKQLSIDSRYFSRKSNLSKAEYQVKLNRAADVAAVWREMDTLGISDVSFTKAEYSRMDEIQNKVQVDAIRNARGQAETMAEAINQKAGKCFYIFCSRSNAPVLYARGRIMSKAMMLNAADAIEEAEEETIEFGNIKVSANVSAKFVLE